MTTVTTHMQQSENHHMVDDDQPIMLALSTFAKLFPYTRVEWLDEALQYSIIHLAFAEAMEREAKQLITENRLPLQVTLQKKRVDAILTITSKN